MVQRKLSRLEGWRICSLPGDFGTAMEQDRMTFEDMAVGNQYAVQADDTHHLDFGA